MKFNVNNGTSDTVYDIRVDSYQVSHPSVKIDNGYTPLVYSNTTWEWARPVDASGQPYGYYYYQASGIKVDSNLRLACSTRRYISSYSGKMSITLEGVVPQYTYPVKTATVTLTINAKDAPLGTTKKYYDTKKWGITFYKIDKAEIVSGDTDIDWSYDETKVCASKSYGRVDERYDPYDKLLAESTITATGTIEVEETDLTKKNITGTASTVVDFGVTFNSNPTISNLTSGFYVSEISTTWVRIAHDASASLWSGDTKTFNFNFTFDVNEVL